MNNIEGVLATLTIKGLLSRTAKDEELTEKLHTMTGAQADAGQYRKGLFPKSACGVDNVYEQLIKARSVLSTTYYKRSLMWEKPFRLVTQAAHAQFDSDIEGLIAKTKTAHEAFINGYGALKELVRQSNVRGQEFKDSDYPDVEKLQMAFRCEINYVAVPSATQFASALFGPAIERAKARLNEMNEERLRAAVSDVWKQVLEPLENMIDKLSDPEARIFDSLVTNVQDISSRIPELNIQNDPTLANAKAALDSLVAGLDPEALRMDGALRGKVAANAARLVASLGQRKLAA